MQKDKHWVQWQWPKCEVGVGQLNIINQLLVDLQKIVFTLLTAQKMKFSMKDFLGKCDQIRRKLRSHLVTFTVEIVNGRFNH